MVRPAAGRWKFDQERYLGTLGGKKYAVKEMEYADAKEEYAVIGIDEDYFED